MLVLKGIHVPRFALLALLAACCGAGLRAQTTTAEITGKVTDSSGGAVAGAAVTVVNVETGTRRETVSNESGLYVALSLQPGTYRIDVQKEGFRTVSRSGITLQVDQTARLEFVLEVGAITESIQVEASAPLLEQDTSALGQVMDNTKIVNIPLNGRSPFRPG